MVESARHGVLDHKLDGLCWTLPMMGTVWVRAPGLDEPVVYAIAPQSALLLGRNPATDKLAAALRHELGDARIRCEELRSSRVSGNHVLIWHTGSMMRIWDLASRNGTWMQLRPQEPIEMTEKVVLALDLAREENTSLLDQPPRPVEWQSERDFADEVAAAVRHWLSARDLHADISVHCRTPQDEGEAQILLASGFELRVIPSENSTQRFSWAMVLDKIHAYVNEQNNRFELLQGHEEGFILASRVIRDAHRRLAEAAMCGLRVLLLGPTGAGKERLARCYHQHSRQYRGPFVTLNCSLLSKDLIYAELFGAKKGSFTGCTSDLVGMIEAANDGTLFLDEIGEMALDVQRALLRFLDSRGEYQRLGDSRLCRSNAQIVCATNVTLDDPSQRASRFREDLWYRLAVRIVRIPPLRERPEDIVAYLRWYRLRDGISAYDKLTPAALSRVLTDSWPGNFRDLTNFLERLPAAARRHSIDSQICDAAMDEGRGKPREIPLASAVPLAHAGASWPEIAAQAAAAFAEDHGMRPGKWGQISAFAEKYLKPVFLAHACELRQIDEVSKNLNLSDLARRMDIADGTTVKLQLQKYIDRFRRTEQEGEDGAAAVPLSIQRKA